MLSDDERLERMEREMQEGYVHDKERERERKRSAAQAAERRKKETRREKMSREWAEEMADFDREIDAKARPEPRNPQQSKAHETWFEAVLQTFRHFH